MPAEVDNRVLRWPTLLRRTDQVCCAGLIVVSLGLITASWLYQGGLRGRIVDVERAEKRPLSFQLDINGAEWPEWSVLPGIGEMLAKRIVDSRRGQGHFSSHEDLLRVHGIGPRTLERIRPFLLPVERSEPRS